MKKTIFLSAALALATYGAFAQNANGSGTPQPAKQMTAEDRAKRQTDRINGIVQLTPEQYKKVLEVTKNTVAQRDALRQSGATGDDVKAKFRDLGKQEDEQLKAILTADQYTKLQAERKEHQGHRPE